MSSRKGPPKHQNKFAWKPNLGIKINETEPGGRFRPLSEITGVCKRCKDQIDWKRKYGKYKALLEPSKCQKCSKRNVRQAYHSICTGCAKEHKVCAKCLCRVDQIVGRDISEVEAEKKALEDAIKNARERDRRTLLRTMNKEENSRGSAKVGDIKRASSLEDAQSNSDDEDNESDVDEDNDSRENTNDNDDHDGDLPKDKGVYEI
ncbi:hypothetical protein Leryth_012135 [Lithospermum erythrorhizon]|nr:hypothetical protein Leryth_012135 [Lithospermum erythrorhizon]